MKKSRSLQIVTTNPDAVNYALSILHCALKKSLCIVDCTLCIILMCACSGSGGGGVSRALDEADTLIFREPASAIALLDSLDLGSASQADRARHALLLTKAREKADIVITDDSLITTAAEYYRGQGDSLEVQSLFYRGVILAHCGDHSAALISLMQAADLANAIGNAFYLAMAYREQADIYSKLYEFEQSAQHRLLAIEAFYRCNKPIHALWEKVALPEDLIHSGKIDQALDSLLVIEKQILTQNNQYLNHLFYQVACNVFFERKDYSNSLKYFDSIISPEDPPQSKLLSQMAEAIIYLGKSDEAFELVNRALESAQTPSDTAAVRQALSKYYAVNNDYRKAYDLLRQAQNSYIPDLNRLVTHPFTASVGNYYRSSNEENIIKRQLAEQHTFVWASLAILSLIVLLFFIYIHRKTQQHRKLETQLLLSDVEKLNYEILHLRNKPTVLPEDAPALNILGSMFNTLCEAQYILPPGERGYHNLGRHSVDLVDNLNAPDVLDGLERLVNLSQNDLMKRFREQLPPLPDNYYKVAVLTLAGFSIHSIIVITKLKEGSLRNIRSKIRAAIRTSKCLDSEVFLKCFPIIK